MKRAAERSASDVSIASDSLLLVQQMLGRYRVKAPHSSRSTPKRSGAPRDSAASRSRTFRREDNKKADRLANLGADASERDLAGERFLREK